MIASPNCVENRSILCAVHKGVDLYKHLLFISGVIKSTIFGYHYSCMRCSLCYEEFSRVYLAETPESYEMTKFFSSYDDAGLLSFELSPDLYISPEDIQSGLYGDGEFPMGSQGIKPVCAGCTIHVLDGSKHCEMVNLPF